jgi:hypothetical protein
MDRGRDTATGGDGEMKRRRFRFKTWIRPRNITRQDLFTGLVSLLMVPITSTMTLGWDGLRYGLWTGIMCYIAGALHGARILNRITVELHRMVARETQQLHHAFSETLDDTIQELINADVLARGPRYSERPRTQTKH